MKQSAKSENGFTALTHYPELPSWNYAVNVIDHALQANRRAFIRQSGLSLGAIALQALAPGLRQPTLAEDMTGGLPNLPHHQPTAKRVIYLFQSGAPSQIELFDHKPRLQEMKKQELPDSIRMGQRLTGMTAGQKKLPIAPSIFKFSQYGQSGTWVSDLLPHTANVIDDLTVIRSMYTEAINHDPAITFFQTGSQLAGRPSIGAWVSYGLGTMNRDLPTYIVLNSRGTGRAAGQPLYDRLWGSGVLPSRYQGVKLRSGNQPVLYLTNPAGCGSKARRQMLDDIRALNLEKHAVTHDPETLTRIEQYELAFRMQTTVPELTDISNEPKHVLEMYGPDVHQPGTYARNCLLARRLIEKDVRFIQLFHIGWDQHDNLPDHLSKQCRDTDQASAALIHDLKQRGLLEDTLVVWGGEFGRTVYSQGQLTDTNYGRDHHPRCFSVWLAGGGVKPGTVYGQTDDFSYNIVENPVHVHDLHATILHCLGIDHRRLSVMYQGLDLKLTGVEEHHPVHEVLI
ncbi:DUF1501 domain-containing protein [Bremerella sp. P1]|uniref:DUF1501 domain-containing protein n=1 Tax=Bremerella sp. P1 TaxID=3026424 RepID=UPI002367A494|nr:DUF1501 domain-containing protein [Bremerella sp. P1]WDI41059.1 DUF1501 domain-containing protein [Bremerella sp. P1]